MMAVDLKMEVYTPTLELVGALNAFQSVMWEENAFAAGSFSLDAMITDESRKLLVEDNILWIEGDTAGIIEHIEKHEDSGGPYITVKGRLLTGILDFRILWGLYDLSGTPADIMHRLVNDCCINPTRGDTEARKIPGLVNMAAPAGGEKIQLQKTGGSLLECMEELGRTYGVAFGVRFNAAVPQMEFWTRYGVNRSVNQTENDPVFYSTELDDVLSSEYCYDSSQYKNVALVAGEGEGTDRAYVTIEDDAPDPPAPPKPVMKKITVKVDPVYLQYGALTVGGNNITTAETAIETDGDTISIVFTAGSGLPSAQAVSVNGGGIGHVSDPGDVVSTTASVSDGMTISVSFADYIPSVTQYTISAAVDPAGSGNVTGAGKYDDGSTANLKAIANDGYAFGQWKESGTAVHNSPDYSFTVDRDRDLTAEFLEEKPSDLPDGYTRVEYIASSGTQYIDTGRDPVGMSKMTLDVEPLEESSSTKYLIHSRTNVSTYYYNFMVRWRLGVGICSGRASTSTLTFTELSSDPAPRRMSIKIDMEGSTAQVDDGPAISISNSTGSGMSNIRILSGATSSSFVPARIYSCQIYAGGSLSRDFVPCIDPSGRAGLFDAANQKFYGDAAGGEFEAGPAV